MTINNPLSARGEAATLPKLCISVADAVADAVEDSLEELMPGGDVVVHIEPSEQR